MNTNVNLRVELTHKDKSLFTHIIVSGDTPVSELGEVQFSIDDTGVVEGDDYVTNVVFVSKTDLDDAKSMSIEDAVISLINAHKTLEE